MASDTRSATLPPEFERASEALKALLDEKLDSLGRSPSLKVWPFPDDLQAAIHHWADELFRIEGGREELVRRAALLQKLTRKGSEFDEAWDRIHDIVDDLRRLGAGITERRDLSIIKADFKFADSIFGFTPLGMSRFNDLIDSLDRLLYAWDSIRDRSTEQLQRLELTEPIGPLTPERKNAVLRLMQVAQSACDAMKRCQSEGCQTLLLWRNYSSLIAADTELLKVFPDSMRDVELQRDCHEWSPTEPLENMRAGVESMAEWVQARARAITASAPMDHERPSSTTSEGTNSSSGRENSSLTVTQTDTPKETEKSRQRHKWDGTAMDAANAFKDHRDAGGQQPLKDFCESYAEEKGLDIKGPTLEKELGHHRQKWDSEGKYGRPRQR